MKSLKSMHPYSQNFAFIILVRLLNKQSSRMPINLSKSLSSHFMSPKTIPRMSFDFCFEPHNHQLISFRVIEQPFIVNRFAFVSNCSLTIHGIILLSKHDSLVVCPIYLYWNEQCFITVMYHLPKHLLSQRIRNK